MQLKKRFTKQYFFSSTSLKVTKKNDSHIQQYHHLIMSFDIAFYEINYPIG